MVKVYAMEFNSNLAVGINGNKRANFETGDIVVVTRDEYISLLKLGCSLVGEKEVTYDDVKGSLVTPEEKQKLLAKEEKKRQKDHQDYLDQVAATKADADKAEADRLEKEQDEKSQADKAEKDRLDQEAQEKADAEKAEAERLEKEKADADKAEADRVAKEKADADAEKKAKEAGNQAK
jgi:hypothetical protein